MDNDDLPNAIQTAVIGGFSRDGQQELLRPYVERYFAVVGDVWRRRTSEVAQGVVTGLFPSAVAQTTVDAVDAYLGSRDVPSALRRLLVEGRAEVARALRARACDTARSAAG